LLLVVIIAAAAYFGYQNFFVKSNGELKASGSIETTQVSVGPEIGGKVVEVLVNEGQTVQAGDALFKLDDTLLKAQRTAAIASLESTKAAAQSADAAVASAQSQYDLALITALNDDKTNRTANWTATKLVDFNQPNWYFTQSEQVNALSTEATAAQKAYNEAIDNLEFVQQKATSATFLESEKRLALARAAFQVAQDVLTRANTALDGQDLKDEAQNNADDAKSELDDAQKTYDDALTTEGAEDVLQARAKVLVSQERFDTTQDRLRALQTGALAPKVTAAQSTLNQAKSAANQAQKAIEQAQAQIDLLDAQIAKLVIVAPSSGTVLTRNVEPGEFVQPGAAALILGNLDDLTITVYMPDSKYGQISLESEARVSVDSFPGKTYTARVMHIADQFEFTPRNIQTVEGRSSTVYAIRLTVTDADKTDLKPGMPADVVFVVGK
jgi:multidrug resistance efflux pump